MRSKNLIIIAVLGIVFLLLYCKSDFGSSPPEKVKEFYSQQILILKTQVDSLVMLQSGKSDKAFQQQFLKCRLTYKSVEPFIEYFNPSTAKAINGPAIVEVEPDNPEYPVAPSGFQVVEESLFPKVDRSDSKLLKQQLLTLKAAIQRAVMVNEALSFNDKAIFDALRLQLFRIQILGLSGFDAPIAQNSIQETKAALNYLTKYLSFYDSKNFKSWQEKVNNLISYLNQHSNFNDLNRAVVFSEYFNPLGNDLVNIQNQLTIPFFDEARPLRADAPHLFKKGIFNAAFYSPSQKQKTDSNLVSLGKMLFFDSKLSSSGERNCGTCHRPEKAFTDGLRKNKSFDGQSLILRNTPTILYAGLQASQFADSRIAFLEDQIKQVAENPLEMHGNLKQLVMVINTDKIYHKKFSLSFPNEPISELKIQEAIAAYIRSKNAFDSRFDQYMQGDKAKINEEEINGFNLFMGKGKCGTCHYMPLFSGNIPPVFMKNESEVIGAPKDKSNKELDTDIGKFILYKAKPHKNSFKTPTLRNVNLTAPYMHNGVYNTLEVVMDFYNNGGGAGLGLNVPNQTLPADKLNLTSKEIKSIIAFMGTLSDQKDKSNEF